jgi:hypothetical protein
VSRRTRTPSPASLRTSGRAPLRVGTLRLTRLRLTPLQWVGGCATVFVALLGLLSGGVWSAVTLVALVLLVTGIYGALLHRPTWLGLTGGRRVPATVAAAALAAVLVGTSAYGATVPAPVAQEQVAADVSDVAAATGDMSRVPAGSAASTPTPTPTPTVTTQTSTETVQITRGSRTEDDPDTDQGVTAFVPGTDGVMIRTFEIVSHDGVEVSRSQVAESVTSAPVDDVTRVGVRVPPPAPEPELSGCDSNYTGDCVPIDSDVDCAAGSGNGPSYVVGPVTVVGSDIYDLDRDGDGVACD